MIKTILTNDKYKSAICKHVYFTEPPDLSESIGNDMIDTVVANRGVGLAAPQIGIYERIITVINKSGSFDIYYNPKIIATGSAKTQSVEWCLSFPGKQFTIKRWKHVTIEYYDAAGKRHVIKPDKKHSIIFQHEIDHLNGKRI